MNELVPNRNNYKKLLSYHLTSSPKKTANT